jgi:hypothetical protein
MKFKKYAKFIKNSHLKNGEFVALVDCAYEKDRKAIFELGTITELRALQDHLAELELFYMDAQNKK